MKSHLIYEERPNPGRRTKLWDVLTRERTKLGRIQWWSPWRRYVFAPATDTVFDQGCLLLLAEFCGEETRKRKKARAEERAQEKLRRRN